MKKVALLYSKNMTDPTGASSVIRTFNENISLFHQNNIDLSVYSRDMYIHSSQGLVSNTWQTKMKLKIATFLKRAAKTNNLAVYLSIYLGSIRPAKRIVDYYLAHSGEEEIVFIHEIFTCYEYIKRKKASGKIIFVMHSNGEAFKMERIYYKKFEKSFFYRRFLDMEQKVLSNISKIGFVAKNPTDIFKELHPDFCINNVFYVFNGLPLCEQNTFLNSEVNRNDGKIEICCVGTVNERKGQRFIVEALNILNNSNSLPIVHFSIIGDGDIKDELQELVGKYNLGNYISFCGKSTNVTNYLLQSDILILPSMDEGFPIAILEAMRVSLPIVSTKVGGIPEMIEEGVTGIFIEPSIEGVCGFISQINNYNWKMMGKESYRLFLEKFTVKSMIDSYCTIMKQL